MVDSVGSSPSARAPAATPVQASAAPQTPAPEPVRAPATAAPVSPSLGSLAKSLAATPPTNPDRVAQIKRAIQTGTFPILPATIADRLLALKLEWTGRDEA